MAQIMSSCSGAKAEVEQRSRHMRLDDAIYELRIAVSRLGDFRDEICGAVPPDCKPENTSLVDNPTLCGVLTDAPKEIRVCVGDIQSFLVAIREMLF